MGEKHHPDIPVVVDQPSHIDGSHRRQHRTRKNDESDGGRILAENMLQHKRHDDQDGEVGGESKEAHIEKLSVSFIPNQSRLYEGDFNAMDAEP